MDDVRSHILDSVLQLLSLQGNNAFALRRTFVFLNWFMVLISGNFYISFGIQCNIHLFI